MSRSVKYSNSNANSNPNVMHSVITATATQHLKRYDGQFSRVEGWLESRPLADEYVTLVATKTGLRKAYILAGGCLLAIIFIIFGPIAKLFGSLVGVSYPAYKSIKAIENPSHEDDRKWLTYWVVFAFFSVARNFSGYILSWFPFYNVVELGILLWMMAPIRRNGSNFIYQTVLRPFVLKHIDTIDSTIDSVKTTLGVPNSTVESSTNNGTNDVVAVKEKTVKQAKTQRAQADETLNESLEKLEHPQVVAVEKQSSEQEKVGIIDETMNESLAKLEKAQLVEETVVDQSVVVVEGTEQTKSE